MPPTLGQHAAVPPLALRPHGRRSLPSRLRGTDERDRVLTCPACGWRQSSTLAELARHVCDSRRRRWWPAAAAAAAVLALVAAGVLLRPGAQASAVGAPGRTQALVLSGSSLSYADAEAVVADLQWEADVYALPGGGISRSTLDAGASITGTARRLLPAPGRAPDVVVLQGGEADHAADPSSLETATRHLLDYVAAHTGETTQVVLVGPIPGATVPDSLRVVNDVLAQVAQERGVAYVDAVGLGWQTADPAVPGRLADALAVAVGLR